MALVRLTVDCADDNTMVMFVFLATTHIDYQTLTVQWHPNLLHLHTTALRQ